MSFWKGKRVVVTGGSGLIGTPMFAKLADLGISWGCNLDIPEYDVLDYNDILGGVSRADVCIHLAAISHVEDSRSRRHNTFDVNVRGTYNVLEACLDAGVKSVVVASSNHVYGNQDVFPVPETAPLNQLDTYSASKIAADYIARAYGHNYGLPVAIIRNTNCFGPEDPHSDHLVPGTILSILRGGRPVLRSTGLTKKGYLYVEDVVNAYLLVAEKLYKGEVARGEVFNVGCTPTSATGLVSMIQSLMGDSSQAIVEGTENDQHDEFLDSSKIRALGWKEQHTITQGLLKTIKAFREREQVVVSA